MRGVGWRNGLLHSLNVVPFVRTAIHLRSDNESRRTRATAGRLGSVVCSDQYFGNNGALKLECQGQHVCQLKRWMFSSCHDRQRVSTEDTLKQVSSVVCELHIFHGLMTSEVVLCGSLGRCGLFSTMTNLGTEQARLRMTAEKREVYSLLNVVRVIGTTAILRHSAYTT